MDGCHDFQRQRFSRREALKAGALTLTGLGLPGLFRGRALAGSDPARSSGGFGRAKACILIFQWGGPSHIDTWDPKPDAPAEIKGTFQPIETKTPGLWISEHFPLLAQQTHRLAVIRSMTHDDAGAPLDGPPGPDRPPRPHPQIRRRRPVTQRLAPPGLGRCQGPPQSGCVADQRDHALDRRPPRRSRRQGARSERRLAGQSV